MITKNIEEQALNDLFECRKYKDKESKRIIKHLRTIRNTKEDSESPDFLFTDGDKIIGVEHFLVDTLRFSDNEKVSISRNISENIHTLLEKYEYGESFKKDKNNYKNAMGDVSKEVVKYSNSVNGFDNKLFLSEFNRIAYEVHDKKRAKNYRSNIGYKKGISDTNISIYYLIEIKYRKQVWNVIDKNGKKYKQAINGIPFTTDFIDCLKKLNNADYIILYFSDSLNQCDSNFVYAFNIKDIDKSLIENKIQLFKDFKAELDGLEIEFDRVER